MFRFDAKKGYYFYPESEGSGSLLLWLNKGSTYEDNVIPRDDISVIKHGLRIPDTTENYKSFVSCMKQNEMDFLAGIG